MEKFKEKLSDEAAALDKYLRMYTRCKNRKHSLERRKDSIMQEFESPLRSVVSVSYTHLDGNPIVWPEPTHAPADSESVKLGLLKPYVGAYTQLDFSLPCPSIFDTAEEIKEKYGIRAVRPLAPKTMERIARGLKKFVLENPEPFIIQCNHCLLYTSRCV